MNRGAVVIALALAGCATNAPRTATYRQYIQLASAEAITAATGCPESEVVLSNPEKLSPERSPSKWNAEGCGKTFVCWQDAGRRFVCEETDGSRARRAAVQAKAEAQRTETAHPDLSAAPENWVLPGVSGKDLRDGIRYRSYGSAFTAIGATTAVLAALSAGISIALAPSGTEVIVVVLALVISGGIATTEILIGNYYHGRADEKLGEQ